MAAAQYIQGSSARSQHQTGAKCSYAQALESTNVHVYIANEGVRAARTCVSVVEERDEEGRAEHSQEALEGAGALREVHLRTHELAAELADDATCNTSIEPLAVAVHH